MSSEYRVIHALTFLGALALLFTGLGSTPSDIRSFLYQGSAKSLIHIALGITSIITLTVYGAYLMNIHGIRLFDGLKKPVSGQSEEAKAVLRNYILGTHLPTNIKQGMARHNVLASYSSILLVVGFAQLMTSGVLLIFLKSGSMYESMLQIHNIGVYLTAIFFFLHLFAVLKGENRPLLRAAFTNGKVPLIWARDHMERFLKKDSSTLDFASALYTKHVG